MPPHRLRRWPSINPALVQRLVLAGSCVQPSKHKTFVYHLLQCWTNAQDFGPTLHKCYTNVLCLLGIAAGLVLLNTAGDAYKPTPTQCLLNVEPASPFFFSFFQISYIYIFTVHTIYSTEQNKIRQYVRHDKKRKKKQSKTKNMLYLSEVFLRV